jgi:hypothetical protein
LRLSFLEGPLATSPERTEQPACGGAGCNLACNVGCIVRCNVALHPRPNSRQIFCTCRVQCRGAFWRRVPTFTRAPPIQWVRLLLVKRELSRQIHPRPSPRVSARRRTSRKGRKTSPGGWSGLRPRHCTPLPRESVRRDAEGEHPNRDTGLLKDNRAEKFAG